MFKTPLDTITISKTNSKRVVNFITKKSKVHQREPFSKLIQLKLIQLKKNPLICHVNK